MPGGAGRVTSRAPRDGLAELLSEARALGPRKAAPSSVALAGRRAGWGILWRWSLVLAVVGAFAFCQQERRRSKRSFRKGDPQPGSGESGVRRGARARPSSRGQAADERVPSRVGYAGMRSEDGRFGATARVEGDSEAVTLRGAGGARLAFGEVSRLLAEDEAFARFFNAVLAASPFEAFYWECPPTDARTLRDLPYEHRTLRSYGFRSASRDDFAEHLDPACARGENVAAFPNLGRDAMLVAHCDLATGPPGPEEDAATPKRTRKKTLNERRHERDDAAAAAAAAATGVDVEAYGHIGNFVRMAPDAQRVAFWAKVGAVYEALVGQGRPVWLSTEGSGVPWLHVRMDSRPKYYHTAEYKPWRSWSQPNPP